METTPERKWRWRSLVWLLPVLGMAVFFLTITAHHPEEILETRSLAAMQACRTIALAEFQYANDHDSKYPTGASSTEVFQKLIDGNYVSDPALFYAPMPGKMRGSLPHLTPQNVCYDVTADVDANSPDGLPLVFLTGFRIEYKAGGRAISLIRPFPQFERPSNGGWFDYMFHRFSPLEGLPICYKSNQASFRSSQATPPAGPEIDKDGFGEVSDVVAVGFDARGLMYRQLTPDGVLKSGF